MSEQSNNIQENNQQILNDIQSLQTIEQELFHSLEINPNLSPEKQQDVIKKINSISNMRLNLYKTLGGVNNFFQKALNNSRGTLEEQTNAVEIIEDELNQSKRRLKLLEEEKNNKIRLVEINQYYGEKYAEHTDLMKILIYILVPVIILAILNNKGILPNIIYYILIVIISIIGGYYFWRRLLSIMMRDNMDYQAYDWGFDAKNAPKSTSSNTTDPWASTSFGTCVGQACCYTGQIYDASLNVCIINPNPTTTTTTTTESFVNNVLTKGAVNNKKPDASFLSNISPHVSNSFINFKGF